jgi:hypothetical protein
LADSTHYDKDKATPTPPIIAMLPLEEEQDTNTNQEQANGVECCYFVAGDKLDQLLHDGSPLIGHSAMYASQMTHRGWRHSYRGGWMNLLRYVLVAGTLALLGLLLYTVATEKYEKRV